MDPKSVKSKELCEFTCSWTCNRVRGEADIGSDGEDDDDVVDDEGDSGKQEDSSGGDEEEHDESESDVHMSDNKEDGGDGEKENDNDDGVISVGDNVSCN